MLLQSVAYQKVTSKYLFYVARYSVGIHYSALVESSKVIFGKPGQNSRQTR